MQQLSLFDFGNETPNTEQQKKAVQGKEKATKTVVHPKVENTESPSEEIVEGTTPTIPIKEVERTLIFSDEKIGVKIKLKAPPTEKKIIEGNELFQNIIPLTTTEKKHQPEEKIVTVKKRGRKSFKEMDAEVDLISVPPDEELFKKQYYSISIVAKWFRVNNSLLRFWENEFKILKPKKNKKGDRFFRPEDVKNLQVIYYLLRQKKLTISGAVKHLKAHKENTEVNLQIIHSLNNFKGFLLELKANTEK
ncbi:MerR family transcriptional regulator [Arachidicoccus sp.]|jgi:DNA-binding transcriptional MerR regulator|uniref:MerR family transcriptional regulator n=1 Tax=Arachidicoccus sp. TaxID=1872624 RepID=UPI003D22DA45